MSTAAAANDNTPSADVSPRDGDGVDTTPFLSSQNSRSRRSFRRRPSLQGAAGFLRRASSRRLMREPSMRVREAAAEQIEERQSDWAYSKPIVILDLLWNLAFVIVSISVLVLSRNESPSMPLRLWIVGYALQSVLHMVCVVVEYRRRRLSDSSGNLSSSGQRSGSGSWNSGVGNLSSESDGGESGDNLQERNQNDDVTRYHEMILFI